MTIATRRATSRPECCAGSTVPCRDDLVRIARLGNVLVSPARSRTEPGACPPAEVCNGADDDCNGATDDVGGASPAGEDCRAGAGADA